MGVKNLFILKLVFVFLLTTLKLKKENSCKFTHCKMYSCLGCNMLATFCVMMEAGRSTTSGAAPE